LYWRNSASLASFLSGKCSGRFTAGRLIYPKGKLTLSMSANEAVRNELLQSLAALEVAA